jgi:uncharacterized protein
MDVDIKFNKKVVSKGRFCNGFFSQLNGLMFSKKLGEGRSLILDRGYESRIDSGIHTLFVFFSLDIVFLDAKKKVVDVRSAKPFVSLITPRKKARYVVEMNAGENILNVGDKVSF